MERVAVRDRSGRLDTCECSNLLHIRLDRQPDVLCGQVRVQKYVLPLVKGDVVGPISSHSDINTANNRIQKAGYSYDAAGNMWTERGKTYVFDGENKIGTANVSGAVSTYVSTETAAR